MKTTFNRRGLFALLGRPLQRTMEPSPREPFPPVPLGAPPCHPPNSGSYAQHENVPPRPKVPVPAEAVAVIQGRRCIALTSFCAVCVERCPVPGAMKVTQGMPFVVPEVCTGCGLCHQTCPAPGNAILMLPRRRATRRFTIAKV